MNPTRRAVIDVGTNSVKLLVGDVTMNNVEPIHEESEQTRLGAGFFETRLLQKTSVEQTAKACATFAGKAAELGAKEIRIIATSAARDALNPELLMEAVLRETGVALKIITGDEEALLVFTGVAADPNFSGSPLLIMDVGGGSTEFILGQSGRILFQHSCQIGAVRGLEKLTPSDPPATGELEKARNWVSENTSSGMFSRLEEAIKKIRADKNQPGIILVGSGGTSTLLSRMQQGMTDYDRKAIESAVIDRLHLREQVERLWAMPLHARRNIIGLPPNRADVILTGSVIFEAVMDRYEFNEMRVSTRGLRFAALL